MDIHIVQSGDTIDSIADKYGVTVDRVLQDNGFISTEKLVSGQTIVITYPEQLHVVQEGETLESIANTYGISIMQLYQYNTFLSEREFIYPGETLVINYATTGNMDTHGFLYPYINRKTLIKTLPLLTYLSVFNYWITEENDILSNGEDSDIIKLALDYGTIPIMMISSITPEGLPNIELMYEILLNKELQDQLIKETITIIKSKGYYGLNFFVSGINTTNQFLYIELFQNFSKHLNNESLYFFITINLNVKDTSQSTTRDKLDYQTISSFVHGVIFLQYYWGANPGEPKPVNNIPQIKSYIEYVETLMPPEKIVTGLTMIGYDWELPYKPNVSRISSLSLEGVILLAHDVNTTIRFDDISQTTYYYYLLSYPGLAIEHVVWFIDARSMNNLLELSVEKNILGSGIWGIMVFNQQLWSIICSKFIINKYILDHLNNS